MPAMVVPVPAEKVDAWKLWAADLAGPRKAEFADMNARLGLDEHRAYLQPQPDGGFLAVVVVEGPGAGTFLPALAISGNAFDAWFVGNVAELHGAVPGGGAPPPMAERFI
jgi:hypothetical protein